MAQPPAAKKNAPNHNGSESKRKSGDPTTRGGAVMDKHGKTPRTLRSRR